MVFSFLGVFCNSLPNQVEHTWLKLMSELEFFWLIGVLTQNFNTMDLANRGHIEDNIMQNHGQKKSEKSEKPRFYEQNKLLFSTLSFIPWAISATWLHVGAPLKIQEK
jgi:hypothetical protein